MDHVNKLLDHCHSQSIREGFVDRAEGDIGIGPLCSSDSLQMYVMDIKYSEVIYYYNQKCFEICFSNFG